MQSKEKEMNGLVNFLFFIVAFALTFCVSGCRTAQKYTAYKESYAQGNYVQSINAFQKDMNKRAKKAGEKTDGSANQIQGNRKYALDDMEIGTSLRALHAFSESNLAFERAEQAIREQQESYSAVNVARQVGAVLTNDNSLPYQIQEYDSIMVNTYKALNLLEQGEIDKTRVEFKRVEERQRMAGEMFQKQIAKAKAEEEAENNIEIKQEDGIKGKVSKLISENTAKAKGIVLDAVSDGENKQKIDEYKDCLDTKTWGAQEVFTNPYASFMQGLFLLIYGEDASDAEASVLAFRKAFGGDMDPVKYPPAQALVMAEAVASANGKGKVVNEKLNNKVFVIFENGLGPEIQQMVIPLVIPLRLSLSADFTFIDASVFLPKLVKRNEAFPYLSVCDNGKEIAKTISVCDMDAVVAAEFRERMTGIVIRNLMQSGVKAVLQALVIDALAQQGVPRIIASGACAFLSYVTKATDLRIWSSLPKNFQVAIVDRPSSGKLQIVPPGATLDTIVDIPEGGTSIVFVHTPSATVPMTVNVVTNTRN